LPRIPLVDLKAQYSTIKSEIDSAIQRVLDSTSFILGSEVENFERSFAEYIGTKGAVGVASGTAALQLALEAFGIGRGDKVITTAHTFFATAEAIFRTGAEPVFVDIEERSYNIDPNLVEESLKTDRRRDGRIRAVIPVHLYGRPAAMDAIMDIAARYDLRVIEDAAQAHGAEDGNKRCGAIGHLACFSFFPGKNLGAYGDGGAVTGNDDSLLQSIRKLRNHGRAKKYEHEIIGFGERLDALQAAILSAKLPHLENWTEARRSHARLYNRLLSNCDVIIPDEPEESRHVYHLYVIRTRRRDEMLAYLNSVGIGAGIHYPIPLHRQPACLKLGSSEVHLPVTEKIVNEIISLPMYPELTSDRIAYVAKAVEEFIK